MLATAPLVTAPLAAPANPVSASPVSLAPLGPEAPVREAAGAARTPDQVAFSPGALLRQLLEAPSVALRQLAMLLPLVESSARADPRESAAVPLGQLASAVGEAARQVGEGYGAVLSKAAVPVPVGPDHPASASEVGAGAHQGYGGALSRAASAAPVGSEQLAGARAEGTGVRQVGAGSGAALIFAGGRQAPSNVPAGPEHSVLGSIEHWRGEASATLRDAASLLQQVEHRLREPVPLAAGDPAPEWAPSPPSTAGADALWALGQVVSAQQQVAWALCGMASPLAPGERRPRGRIRTARPDQAVMLAGSIALLGTALLAVLLWLAVGWWLAVAGVAGALASVAASAGWGWRLAVTWRGLRLDLRR